eukprot:COSAG04_NODE_32471_length_251_cov_0.486842_1_plen_68_part_01
MPKKGGSGSRKSVRSIGGWLDPLVAAVSCQSNAAFFCQRGLDAFQVEEGRRISKAMRLSSKTYLLNPY